MPSSASSRRHSTLKIGVCVLNAITACELGFVAVFFALFALFDNSGDVNVGYIPFVVVAVLLGAVGVVLARLPWRESIGTAVANLVFFFFTAVPVVITASSNGFRPLFCAMSVAPLAGCCLCARYLSLLRRDKRVREREDAEERMASASGHREDEISTAYAHAVTLSPTASPRTTSFEDNRHTLRADKA